MESRDASTSGVGGMVPAEAYYPPQYPAGIVPGGPVVYAPVGGPPGALYPGVATAGAHPMYAATGEMLQYGPYGPPPGAGYAMALQPPGVTYAPYYPPAMTIDTSLSASYSASGPFAVNYAVQPLDTPTSTASGVTNYAFMGSGSNTPSVTHHQTANNVGTSGPAYAYDSGSSVQTQHTQQKNFNFGNASTSNYNNNSNNHHEDDEKGGKVDKEGRYVSRNNYRCGKCGKQKANHICAYVDTALTSMGVQVSFYGLFWNASIDGLYSDFFSYLGYISYGYICR